MKSRPQIDRLYTVGEGGQRNFLHPARVDGIWTRLRRRIGIALMALLAVLPFVHIGGTPAIWLDVAHRRFHVFGLHLGPTDSYLLFFLLTGVGFVLVVTSALWGRVWCGYACPQTVFLEGLYRPIERLFEGSREQQLRLERAPWGPAKIARKVGKTLSFALLSVALAHLFLAYFVSAPVLWELMRQGPHAEPGVFAWAVSVSALMFGNFAWFREQLCIVICPYGRLQSVLSDRDTVVVGYDQKRGEPRGKSEGSGDCVDCGRCISVCPTGIDIRQGLQLECVGCAGCIDVCAEVMLKLHRAPGLIRYDSQRGLDAEPRRFLRPRLGIYMALLMMGLVALVVTLRAHRPFAITLSRQAGAPYVIDGDTVRNTFVLKADNDDDVAQRLLLSLRLPRHAHALVATPELMLPPHEVTRVPIVIASPRNLGPFDLTVTVASATHSTDMQVHFAAPAATVP